MINIKKHTLTHDIVAEIGRFTILWSLFEQKQCENDCSANKIKTIYKKLKYDKNKVINFANVLESRRIFLSKSIIDYVNDNLHPQNARSSNSNCLEEMCDFLNNDDASLYGCLLIIYRIRNNLLHGLKSIEELDGQLELFKAINEVLESIK